MAFPDLTSAEEALCTKIKEGFPALKVDVMPGDLSKWVKTRMRSTRGIALVQFVRFNRIKLDEAREGWTLQFEVTILNKQLTTSGHTGVHDYLQQSITALHRESDVISGIDYTYLVDQGGFTGIADQLWEYAFSVQMVPSLTL